MGVDFNDTFDLGGTVTGAPAQDRRAAMRVIARTSMTAQEKGDVAEALGLLAYMGADRTHDNGHRRNKASTPCLRTPGDDDPPPPTPPAAAGNRYQSARLTGRRIA